MGSQNFRRSWEASNRKSKQKSPQEGSTGTCREKHRSVLSYLTVGTTHPNCPKNSGFGSAEFQRPILTALSPKRRKPPSELKLPCVSVIRRGHKLVMLGTSAFGASNLNNSSFGFKGKDQQTKDFLLTRGNGLSNPPRILREVKQLVPPRQLHLHRSTSEPPSAMATANLEGLPSV